MWPPPVPATRGIPSRYPVDNPTLTAPSFLPGAAPRWVDLLLLGLVSYVIAGTLWMLTGFGGPQITHYVGLVSDAPAALASIVVLGAAAACTARGPLRTAWILLTSAVALYFIGILIGTLSWLRGQDPFPGPADVFYCVFYVALAGAVLFLIRAAAVRVAWVQLSLDATIFAVGFGAFFWFLVIRPAASRAEVDLL